MNASKRLFELKNIACVRGGRALFQNLSCTLQDGDLLHLSGANGTGKTSLLRIMAGALRAARGDILWNRQAFLADGPEEHARRIAFLPSDDRNLKVLETAGENLDFWASLGASGNRNDALTRMGLQALADTPVRRLSAGQRRRLSLARILLSNAPVWLLDEPINGLDAASADLFRAALNDHVAKGGMAAIASHYPVEPPQAGSLRRVVMGAA